MYVRNAFLCLLSLSAILMLTNIFCCLISVRSQLIQGLNMTDKVVGFQSLDLLWVRCIVVIFITDIRWQDGR